MDQRGLEGVREPGSQGFGALAPVQGTTRARADLDAGTAQALHHGEAGFVGHVVAGKHRHAARKGRLLHEGLDRQALAHSGRLHLHHGLAVLVDSEGEVLESHGNIQKPMYPRSALKPVQALVMRELGLDLAGVELVLSMASHLGTQAHIDAVDQILSAFSLSRSDL